MPQRDLLLPWLTALDNAALALRIAGEQRDARAAARAPAVRGASGLVGFERARPRELSGGMRQRVAFAAHAARRAPGALPRRAVRRARRADAPRDAGVARRARCAREPRTVLLVTHDVEEARPARRPRPRAAPPRPGRSRVDVELPRPRRATDAGSRAARARAGGPGARDDRASLVAARVRRRLGGLRPPGRRRQPHPPRAQRGRDRAVGRPRAAVRPTCSVTAQEVALGILVALVVGARWPSPCTSPARCAARVYPLLIASQAMPIVIVAPLLVVVVRLRARCPSS